MLREVLNDPEASAKLDAHARRSALWSLSAELVPSIPSDCESGEELHLIFEFGAHARRSSRVYRLRFATCHLITGTVRVSYDREGFGSNFALEDEPVCADARGMTVLRQALNDATVFDELAGFESHSGIEHVALLKRDVTEDDIAIYDFVVADSSPGDWTAETRILEHVALYDLATERATFRKKPGDS
jgi:hypothetical protein